MYYPLLQDIPVAFYVSTEEIAVWFCSLHFIMKDYSRSAGLICKQPLKRSSLPKNATLCELHMDNLFHRIIHSCYSVNTLSARDDSRIVDHDL